MTDTKFQVKCPACGNEMLKIYIPSEKIYVDICTDGCGGIFFDNRELDKFDDACEDYTEIAEALKSMGYVKIDDSVTRICPACGAKMVKNGEVGGVIIDVCNICGGKFLDNGELEKIRAAEKGSSEIEEAIDILISDSSIRQRKTILSIMEKII